MMTAEDQIEQLTDADRLYQWTIEDAEDLVSCDQCSHQWSEHHENVDVAPPWVQSADYCPDNVRRACGDCAPRVAVHGNCSCYEPTDSPWDH